MAKVRSAEAADEATGGVAEAVHLSISDRPVNRIAPSDGARAGQAGPGAARAGAWLEFLGVVRDRERGRPIRGIRYTAYQAMAERHLRAIAGRGRERWGAHHLVIHHVTGFVAAGEASLLLRVAFPHSAEAFDACRWYLAEIKSTLPVWKEPVFADA